MPLPRPFPGLVVRYAYLWADEAAGGAREGRKDRPCVVVLVAVRRDDGRLRVRVLPITHRPPGRPDRGVAMSPRLRRHLGLDEDASWIILDESNEFFWPGPDLRPVARDRPGVWSFGVLPVEVFEEIQRKLRAALAARRVTRSE